MYMVTLVVPLVNRPIYFCMCEATYNNVSGNMLVNRISDVLFHVSADMVRRVKFVFQRRGKSLTVISVTSLSFGEFAGQNSILLYGRFTIMVV